MLETPRRKRFQIHLSTAIVMMFVAGALMWANATPIKGKFIIEGLNGGNTEVTGLYGWPFYPPSMTKEELDLYNGFADWVVPPIIYWGVDLLIAVLVLFVTWFLSERLIRRRAAQK